MADVRYEITKELTLKALDKIDTSFGIDKTAVQQNELLAKEVGKLYTEILKSVFSATDQLNK